MDEGGRLHLVQLELEVPKLLAAARVRGVSLREADLGYVVHGALGQLFGDCKPGPFALTRLDGRVQTVLAYSAVSADRLRAEAEAVAKPDRFGACRWEALVSKPMPQEWPVGKRLGFEVRVCPVRRGCRTPEGTRGEADAFLAACWRAERDERACPSREVVYREWFAERWAAREAAELVRVELRSWRRARVLRRTQGESRKARVMERPEAVVAGELAVTDGEAFGALLARGIGRHRAFGFGMVLLRPAGWR